ncbi:MAG: ADP-glyceromanno-heptose 6-epimerase [Bacteroidales bacterium]|nr:ADP-glyceromanno-heptose 6-epimerase [Bacteroidales bacterium]
MIVITGAAGFIASAVAGGLNEMGRNDLILVDDFSQEQKNNNWIEKKYNQLIDRKDFTDWLDSNYSDVDFVIHLGARTDTTEFDWNVFLELNLHYSQAIWKICSNHNIPLIYASSAATYGAGEQGYKDENQLAFSLKPLNPYGKSKNDFDQWALQQEQKPPFWAGLKFFNVYGPNEYHKGRMASVILHTFESVNKTGAMKLFRSHRDDFEDGMQLRDFVYVKDIVKVIKHLMNTKPESGLYNVGTGRAQSFLELANATFDAMGKERNITFIDIPEDIRDKYQYFTEADMSKLRSTGYKEEFYDLRNGVFDYVQNYLIDNKYL